MAKLKPVITAVLLIIIVVMPSAAVHNHRMADQYQTTLNAFRTAYDEGGKGPMALSKFTEIVKGDPEVVELGDVFASEIYLKAAHQMAGKQTKRAYQWKSLFNTYEITLTIETNKAVPDHQRIVAYDATVK